MPLTNGVTGRGITAAVDARDDASLIFDGNAALAAGSERTRTNSSRSSANCATNVSLTREYCCSSRVGLDGRDKSPGTRYTFCVPRDGKRPTWALGASSIGNAKSGQQCSRGFLHLKWQVSVKISVLVSLGQVKSSQVISPARQNWRSLGRSDRPRVASAPGMCEIDTNSFKM
jgi:hypothetical protein